MAKVSIFVGVHTHRHGTDVYTDTTMEGATATQAKIAREWWEERADTETPEDHSALSDEEVIGAYFDENSDEFYEIVRRNVEIDPKSLTKAD